MNIQKKENNNILKIRKRPFKIIWTEEEDRILFSMTNFKKKKSWKTISDMLINKTPSQCFYRFHSKNSIVVNKNWTLEEDIVIKDFVRDHGKKWERLANILNVRTAKQIKDRYKNKLDENLIRSKFSLLEDDKITALFIKYGSKWSYISKFIKGRTPDMIKSRFYSSLQKKIFGDSENFNNEIIMEKDAFEIEKSSDCSVANSAIELDNILNQRKNIQTQLSIRLNQHIISANSALNQKLNFVLDLEDNTMDEYNITLTDISIDENDRKDSHSNSISRKNSNSNPSKSSEISHNINDIIEKSLIVLLNNDDINKKEITGNIKNIDIENEFNDIDYLDYSFNFNNNNHNVDLNNYIQNQIQDNFFEEMKD